MNRRELLQRSAAFGLAAGLGSVRGSEEILAQAATVAQSAGQSSPLPVPAGGMLPAAFVLGKDAEVLDVVGPLDVFAQVMTKDGRMLFAPYMVAATKDPVTIGCGMKMVPDYDFKTAPQPKVIVIPAMEGASQEMCDWIRAASKGTDVTMSICNGAYVLAKSGLLNGKSATLHHGAYFMLAAMYPEVHLKRGVRFVEDGNLASSGGVTCGIDLALRVVERYVGRDRTEQLVDGLEYQGKGWLNPNSNESYARMPKMSAQHPICAVCLMDTDRTISSTHKGKTYYFCSNGDKEMFEKHTDVFDRFLAEDAVAKSKI